MRKYTKILTFIAVAISLSGCGKQAENSIAETQLPVITEIATEEPTTEQETESETTAPEKTETFTEKTATEQETETAILETELETTEVSAIDTDVFIATVKDAINGTVGANEKITSVNMEKNNLIITVDLSNVDEIMRRDMAIVRISSITDAVLELDNRYYNVWETITVDCGNVGTIVLDKSIIKDEGFGKFFDFKEEDLK